LNINSRANILKRKLKGKHPKGRPRLRWKQQVRKCSLMEGRKKWEKTEEKLLWQARHRGRGMVRR